MVVRGPKLFLSGEATEGRGVKGERRGDREDAKERERETDHRGVCWVAADSSNGRLEFRGFAISRFRGSTTIMRVSRLFVVFPAPLHCKT
jgi:hypothetical protein